MRSSRGSTSRGYASPLTVTVICMSSALAARPPQRPAQRAHGKLPGQVPLVAGRAALIRARPAVLGRDLAGPCETLLGGRRAAQELLGLRGGEVLRADGGQADPGVGDGAAVQPQGGARGTHRPVAHPAPYLLIGT